MDATTSIPPPLDGVKVIELSHLIAAPYCGMLLAEEGANVIKVEPPQGELARAREPLRAGEGGSVSAHYAAMNRGKKSLVLDLKNRDGIKTLRRLLESADVFLSNMRGGALDRLGIHPKTLHREYPGLVVASITGFGLENAGPNGDRAGLALVAEAMSGTTGLTRDHSGQPVWCGFALGDIAAGMTAHAAILLALRNQEKYGRGRMIDLSLAECALPMVSVALARVQFADRPLSSFAGSNDFHGVPYGAFPASDGAVNLGVNSDVFWRRLCVAMDREELGNDVRFATYLERAKRQAEVHEITERFTKAHTRAEIVAKLSEADVPAAGILNMEEVLELDYFEGRNALREVDDGTGGRLRLPSDPARFEAAPGVPRVPRLGEHQELVLTSELGLSQAEIDELERAGAFGAPRQSDKDLVKAIAAR